MTVWETLNFERQLKKKLIKDFKITKGDELYGDYINARKVLVEEILPQIPTTEPSLTDHSSAHIANVLNNVDELLGENIYKTISGIDLYCLGVSILFHDVGNLLGRLAHNRKISEIYDYVRKPSVKYRQEKTVILRATEAHCGFASDGSRDTLKDLTSPAHLHGKQVNLRDIAAVLRFADELAEGPQRTSRYMQNKHNYAPESEIYHQYANIINILIDHGNGRIILTFNIEVDELEVSSLKTLLTYSYKRIIKLDEERKYCKHYCNWLTPFKITSASFNFWSKGERQDIGLRELNLSDLTVPEESQKTIEQIDTAYNVNTICGQLYK